jgi:hypothetical protein
MGDLGRGVVSVVMAILGIALVAVIIGKGSQAGTVITSTGSALSSLIKTAVAPAS